MNSTSTQDIFEFLKKIAGLEGKEVSMDADIQKDLNINSFTVIKIVSAVEVKYGVKLDDAKVFNVRTVRDFVHLVEDTIEFGR